MKDYYKILNISKEASQSEIKKAYRKMSKQHHPDVSKEQGAEERFKDISEAYSVLSDTNKRNEYDNPNQGFNFSDFFSGFRHNNQHQYHHSVGESIKINVSIDLETVDSGTEETIQYTRTELCETCDGDGGEGKQTCTHCNGTGRVIQRVNTNIGVMVSETICPHCMGKGDTVSSTCGTCNASGVKEITEDIKITIPKGVHSGMQYKYTGRGSVNKYGAGDLIIQFHIVEHPRFKRVGNNLYTEIEVPINTMILGGVIQFSSLNGKMIDVTIPKMCTPGYSIYVSNSGLPIINTKEHGDLIIKINIAFPTDITDDEIDIISQLNSKDNFTY